jgi:type II secretory pathway pseudopilin PulG
MTLVEAIGVTIMVGIMGSLAFPAISGLRQAGQDQQAIGIAQALNQAQQTYQMRVSGAATAWATAASADAQYALIQPYIPYAAATLEQYEPSGYTIGFDSSLDDKVTLTGPNGPISY